MLVQKKLKSMHTLAYFLAFKIMDSTVHVSGAFLCVHTHTHTCIDKHRYELSWSFLCIPTYMFTNASIYAYFQKPRLGTLAHACAYTHTHRAILS